MKTILSTFLSDEDGAVTVDWVVLTAAVAGLSIAFVAELNNNTSGLSGLTSDYLADQDPAAAAGGNIQD